MRWYASLGRRLGTTRWFPRLARPWLARADLALYRLSGGRLTVSPREFPFLVLETIGARSGRPRAVPLYFAAVEGGFAVAGSNYGSGRIPDWSHNLRAHRAAVAETRERRIPVRAREIHDERERSTIWAALDAAFPGYAEYRQRVAGRIPLFVLEPEATRPVTGE